MHSPILERPFFVALRGLILTVAVVAIPLAALMWKGAPPWLERLIFWDSTAAVSDDDVPNLPAVSVGDGAVITSWQQPVSRAATPQIALRDGRDLYHSDAASPARYTTMAYTPPGNAAAPNGIAAADTQQMLVAELEQLGAQYYRLEKWGDDGTFYRLSCLVSPPGMSHYQKHFQAIDDDAIKVLRQVITAIHQWHAETAAMQE